MGGGGKILSVAHKSVADPGFEVTGGPTFLGIRFAPPPLERFS